MEMESKKVAEEAVLLKSEKLEGYEEKVKGYDWSKGIDYEAILNSYKRTGFQATNFGLAVDEINRMVKFHSNAKSQGCSFTPIKAREEKIFDEVSGESVRGCTIFLAYTSNLVSSGLRESIKFLVKENLVDCLVTTAGGVEEDFIKCLSDTLLGDFHLPGKLLRDKGINRIGNLLVPNDNYCKFEDWMSPILDEMITIQESTKEVWTPSKMIKMLGEKIGNEDSIYYWAAKNNIPVYSPALTDGSLGDVMFFHSFKKPGLVLDILGDLKALNCMAMRAKKTGVVILGGGLIKHHVCNANLMRNGSEYAVFINTGQEFDGSDSGARPDEAVSWGKIKKDAAPVKVYADATLVFPIVVAQTFARSVFNKTL